MKVLMIEDEDALFNMYKTELEESGWKVVRNSEGKDVEDFINKEKPDIILLDIMLPEESGLSILKKIKENPDTSKVPVVMLTNYGNDANIKKAIETGAEDFILKYKIVPSEVVEKLRALTGTAKGGVKIKE